MSGPVNFSELFNFPEYEDAIRRITAANKEFADTLRSVGSLMKQVWEASQKDVAVLGQKFEATNENLNGFSKIFTNVNSEVEAHGVKIATLKKAYKDFEDTITVTEDSVLGLGSKLKTIKAQYDSLDPSIVGNKEKMSLLAKEYQDTTKQISSLEKELKGATKTVAAAEGSYTFMSQKLTEFRKRIKDIPGAFDEMTGAINEADPEVKKIADDIKKYDTALKAADASMGNFTRNVGDYEGKTVSLKSQLRTLIADMAEMKAAGKDDSDAYREMAKAAGEMKLAIGDANDEVKYFGAERQNLQGVIGVLQGVGAAAGIAEGGMALFGIQNKSVEESIKRLVAIQTIMNGVNEIGTILEKESAAMLFVTNAQKKIGVLATRLQTAAESESIVIRKAATAAQWLLNKAMNANPAFLLITIIAALAGAVLLLTRNSKEQAEAQEAVNEKLQAYLDLINERLDLVKKSSDIQVEQNQRQERSLQNQIDLKKAQRATDEELVKLQTHLDEVKIKNANQLRTAIERQNKEALVGYNIALNVGEKASTLEEARTQLLKRTRDAQVELNKIGAKEGIDSDLYKAQKTYLDNINSQYSTINGQIKNMADANKGVADAYKTTEVDKLNNTRLLHENYLKGRLTQINTELQKSKEGSEQEYQIKLKQIERQRQLDIYGSKTLEDKNLINAKAERDTAELTADYKLKIAQSEVNAEISILNSKLSVVQIGSDSELRIKQDLIDKEAQLSILGIKNSINNETEKAANISEINSKALKDKKDLEREKLKSDYDNNQESIKAARDLAKIKAQITLADNGTSKQEKKAAAKILTPQQDLIANEKQQKDLDLNKAMFATAEEYEKAKDALVLEHEQIRLGIIQQKAEQEKEIRQGVFDTIIMGIQGLAELYKSDSDARISQFDMAKANMLKLAGDDKDKQWQIEMDYQKKINKEKAKQAKIDRAMALFNIAISTAQAVMSVLSTGGGTRYADAGITAAILSGIVIAQGAIQAGLVLAKPLPQFRSGTKNAPEGFAVVNDAPGNNYKELIFNKKSGAAYIPQKRNQVTWLNRGDVVLNAVETQGILNKNKNIDQIVNQSLLHHSMAKNLAEGRKFEVEHTMLNAMQSIRLNEKEIGREVGEQLKGITIEQTVLDERGYRKSIKKGNTTIVYLNERHSLNG
jgi:hypothetical protein